MKGTILKFIDKWLLVSILVLGYIMLILGIFGLVSPFLGNIILTLFFALLGLAYGIGVIYNRYEERQREKSQKILEDYLNRKNRGLKED